jgi:hypothetical protein
MQPAQRAALAAAMSSVARSLAARILAPGSPLR